MIARQTTADTGLGVSFVISTVIHLAVFLLVLWWSRLTPENMALQETYYVDVVNLPVAAPRAGSPTQKGNDAEQAPPPRAVETPMSLPSEPKAEAKGKTGKTQVKGEPDSSAFAERMARLESKSEAQQAEAALQALQKKVTPGSGRSGMPAASGEEAGSDYTAYIQSRLKDAFRETISYSSKSPEMVVRLYIATDGRISRKKAERSSGDRAFEISVLRAIDLASEKFTPPPNRKMFEGVFVFRPQGITQNRP
ncbi:MAG: TonB family protein [Deltaproteobacteria bacterium]|nr:TonB family protein [Deltaproteobacteria bacterium]